MKTRFPVFDKEAVEEIEACLDMHDLTEIEYVEEMSGTDGQLNVQYAIGHVQNGYARPMLQLICDGRGISGPDGTACQCGDFSRTWNCPDHGEIPWDAKKRRWIRPHDALGDWIEQLQNIAYTAPEMPGPPTGRWNLGDPNWGRSGYHYNVAADRWVANVPGTAMSVRGETVTYPEVSAVERMAAEWERQNGVHLTEAVQRIATQTITVSGYFGEGTFTYEIEAPDA